MYIAKDYATVNCEAVNIASGDSVRIVDVLNYLFESYNVDKKPVFGGEVNAGNPAHYQADVSVIRKWSSCKQIDLFDGIKQFVEWYKKYGKN